MLFKLSCLVLLLTVSQAFATSIRMLRLRGFESLEARQADTCSTCTPTADAIKKCAEAGSSAAIVACACTSTINAEVQTCINCLSAAGEPVQEIVDAYNELCAGTAPPTITNPGTSEPTGSA